MSQIPRRSISLSNQPNEPANSIHSTSQPSLLVGKFYKILSKVMFTKQLQKKDNTTDSYRVFHYVLLLLAIFGVSWIEARRWSKCAVSLIAVYNIAVILIQSVFLVLIVVDFNSTNVTEYQWTATSFYLYGLVLVFSLWMNVRLHLVRQNIITEALFSYSISSEFVERKKRMIKYLCIGLVVFSIMSSVLFIVFYQKSNDIFEIRNAKNWPSTTIFSCGLFCDVLFHYVSIVSIVTIAGGMTIFVVLAASTGYEANRLLKDISKYPANDGLDHLIFRYQSIEQSATTLNDHFTFQILGYLLIGIAGTVVMLRHYTQLMIERWETGAACFCFFYGFAIFILCAFLISATYLNEQLIRFREASQKVSDFEQIYVTNQNSIRLLSFMLRLSDAKGRMRIGNLIAINQQTIFTLSIVLLFAGFGFYSIDTGCLNVF
ncbi:hypothetical protein M3Y95_00041500 [Aphelenchoides besseyi]|nr:hypothetical protein M3Y95_00041500 [Aphelenchoides besseyi]